MSLTSLVAFVLVAGSPQGEAEKLFTAVKSAVVKVNAGDAVGTGFAVANGATVITCWHVVRGSVGEVLVDGKPATIQSHDELADIAVLKVSKPLPKALKLSSGLPSPGAKVYVVGNPLGYLSKSITEGIISAVRKIDDVPLLQMTAPISPGSSGSPVMNASGQVVGMASAYLAVGQSLNFAVPSGELSRCMTGKARPPASVLTPSGAHWVPLKEIAAKVDTFTYASRSQTSISTPIGAGEITYQVGAPVGNWIQVYTEGNTRSYVLKDKFKATGLSLRADPADDFIEYIESKAYVDEISELVKQYGNVFQEEKREEAREELLARGFRAMCVISRLGSRPDRLFAYDCASALAIYGEDAKPILVRLLASKREADRIGGANTIERMATELYRRTRPLPEELDEEEVLRQKEEAEVVQKKYAFLAEPDIESLLLDLLQDSNEMVKAEAVDAVAPLKLQAAKRTLLSMLMDKDSSLAMKAVRAVIRFEDPTTTTQIQSALEQICIARSVDETEEGGDSDDSYIVYTISHAASEISLLAFEPSDFVVVQALAMLDHSNADMRAAGASILDINGTTEHIPRLEPLTKDKDPMVRRTAIATLTAIDSETFMPLAKDLLVSTHAPDRLAALNAISLVQTDEAVDLMISLLTDKSPYIVGQMFFEIGYRTEPKVGEFLRGLLKSEDADTRKNARAALDRHLEAVEDAKKDQLRKEDGG